VDGVSPPGARSTRFADAPNLSVLVFRDDGTLRAAYRPPTWTDVTPERLRQLAGSVARQGKFARLLPALLLYVVFSNLLAVAKVWVEDGVVSVAVGMWWVHALFGLALVLVLPGTWAWRRVRWRMARRSGP